MGPPVPIPPMPIPRSRAHRRSLGRPGARQLTRRRVGPAPRGQGDTTGALARRDSTHHATLPISSHLRPHTACVRERRGAYLRGVVSVLVVERDPVLRRGLASFAAEGADTVVEMADPATAREEMSPATQVVVAGVAPDDLAALALGGGEPAPALLLVTPRVTDALVREAFSAGAKGLLLRHSVVHQLADAIEVAAQGGTWADPEVTAVLTELSGKGRPQGTDARGLTVQERRVLRLLPRQLTNREIAAELGVATDTVKTHLRNAMAKLGAHDRIEAARIAEREDIR